MVLPKSKALSVVTMSVVSIFFPAHNELNCLIYCFQLAQPRLCFQLGQSRRVVQVHFKRELLRLCFPV